MSVSTGEWRATSGDELSKGREAPEAAVLLRALLPQELALKRFVRRLVRPSSDVEDIVQEAYLRLMQAPPRVREPQALLGYLFVIARHVIADRARRSFRERRRVAAFASLQEQLAPAVPSADELVFVEQATDILRRALAQLPEPVRQVFLLHRMQGLRQSEIAARLGIATRTVERYVAFAIAHLKQSLFRSEGARRAPE